MTDHTDTPLERLAALAYDLAEAYVTAKTDPAAQMDLLCKDLRSLLSELTTLREEKERLASALRLSRDQFLSYAAQHRAKIPPDNIKAGVNEDMGRRAASALEEGK